MKITKSFMACVLTAAVGAAVLSGCGGAKNDNKPSTPDEAAAIKDNPVVSYLGTQGSYTEEAAKAFFADVQYYHPSDTIDKAIDNVINKTADYAVIPQENTVTGAAANYIDAVINHQELYVVGEVIVSNSQALLGVKGAQISDVKTVASYSQGFAQSKDWRQNQLPEADEKNMNTAALAASFVSEENDKSCAAIAPPGYAKLYGLDVLAENIQSNDTNKTRFYVLSLQPLASGNNSRVVFTANCTADKIDDVIVALNQSGFELVTLHDRTDGSSLGAYRYLIEAKAEKITQEQIDKISKFDGVRFAGTFNVIEK